MAEEEVRKLVLPYDHTQLPALLASIKNETELRTFILEYAEAKGTSLTENQVNTLIANYITENNIGSGNSQSGTGLTPEQAQKLAILLTGGDGSKYLGDDGNYHNTPRDGVDGQNGTNGVDGSDGVGISNITASQSGENVTLTISLTDGTSKQVTFTAPQGGVTQEEITQAVTSYLTENPVTGVTNEAISSAVSNYLTENPVSGISVEDQAKLDKIVINGDKKLFLNQKGNYVDIEDDIVKEFAEDNTIWGSALPIIFLDFETDSITGSYQNATVRYVSQFKEFTDTAQIKTQGNSSLSYPKKNINVKFTEKHGFGWGKHKKYTLKANYIDHSHSRNIVCARLWSEIVKSRSDYETNETMLRLADTPNNGCIDGFPVKVYLNGKYCGLYTLNIPKCDWMLGLNSDTSTENQAILYSENYTSGLFRKSASFLQNSDDWTDELNDVVPEVIKTRWNEVISFVMTSSDTDFRNNLDNYIDVKSIIDYYIFSYATCNLDGLGKNQIFFTYDNTKYYASAYDMDSTFGLYWSGAYFVSSAYRMQEDYESMTQGRSGNLLYIRLASLFSDEIKTRYVELRSGALSASNILSEFEKFIGLVPTQLYDDDMEIYNIPSASSNNMSQLREYVVDRLTYVDGKLIDIDIANISINGVDTVKMNGTRRLGVTYSPSNANTQTLVWSSSDTSVATVDQEGNVTPVSVGSVSISVTDTTTGISSSFDMAVIADSGVISGTAFYGSQIDNTNDLPLPFQYFICLTGYNNQKSIINFDEPVINATRAISYNNTSGRLTRTGNNLTSTLKAYYWDATFNSWIDYDFTDSSSNQLVGYYLNETTMWINNTVQQITVSNYDIYKGDTKVLDANYNQSDYE